MAEFREVVKQYKRFCEDQVCTDCPLHGINDEMLCIVFKNPVEAEKIIMDWASEHPAKTWLTMLKEVLPEAHIDITQNCPRNLFGANAPSSQENNCDGKCVDCWNREVIP